MLYSLRKSEVVSKKAVKYAEILTGTGAFYAVKRTDTVCIINLVKKII